MRKIRPYLNKGAQLLKKRAPRVDFFGSPTFNELFLQAHPSRLRLHKPCKPISQMILHEPLHMSPCLHCECSCFMSVE